MPRTGAQPAHGFTLIEVMITMALLLILIISSLSAILFFRNSAGRLATYTAAAAVVEGRIEAIRCATYNPPNYPFTASTVTTNFTETIWLDKPGQNFLVTGAVACQITPITGGHFVTATGTFTTPGKSTVVSLQTIVNKFSGGQE
jgi:prepilin-type N-terminal cleavage/methylation domain-containing protein